jgi:hypothetical protein
MPQVPIMPQGPVRWDNSGSEDNRRPALPLRVRSDQVPWTPPCFHLLPGDSPIRSPGCNGRVRGPIGNSRTGRSLPLPRSSIVKGPVEAATLSSSAWRRTSPPVWHAGGWPAPLAKAGASLHSRRGPLPWGGQEPFFPLLGGGGFRDHGDSAENSARGRHHG